VHVAVDDDQRPAPEIGAVTGRDAEQLGDDGDRQGEPEAVHEVDRASVGACRGHVVEQGVGDLLDARRQRLDAANGERGGH
jgi:hypothetical protein